jgi:hypothetical protein
VERSYGGISKTPELHSHDLENPAERQAASLQSLRKLFHFSCSPTAVTVFFFYLTTLFLPARRVKLS